jgi:nitrogen fixation NifU-like protein
MTGELYRERILDHFQHPRHRGSLDAMQSIGHGSIPLCGDEVEVGIREMDDGRLAVMFRGRGCAVCIASASMMAETLTGFSRERAEQVARAFIDWMLHRAEPGTLSGQAPELIEVFAAVRDAGSRARCATLPWGALGDALARAERPQATSSSTSTGPSVPAASAPG